LRNGARALLARAVEAEVADFLDEHADLKTADGRQRVVSHGHLPEREVEVRYRSRYGPANTDRPEPTLSGQRTVYCSSRDQASAP